MRGSIQCLILALLVPALVGCSRPPDLIGIDNPATPAASMSEVDRHRIFITTTREASEVVGAFYSGDRAPDLGLASVDVTVPPNHVVGQLERPRRMPPDPLTEFAVVAPVVYRDDASFIAEINRELATRPPDGQKLLLFVHGYNNTTSDAILRLTQFVEDTDYQGVPVLFTWASAARAPRYVYDLNSALVARVKLKDMADIQQAGRLGARKNIDHIMLASPDIDIDLFRTQLGLLPQAIHEKMYLFVSRNDGALRVSRRIAGGVPRVGAADAAELEKLGLTVIDLSEVNNSSSGSHSKFAGSPEVVKLIGAGLNSVGRFGEDAPGLDQLLTDVPIRIVGN